MLPRFSIVAENGRVRHVPLGSSWARLGAGVHVQRNRGQLSRCGGHSPIEQVGPQQRPWIGTAMGAVPIAGLRSHCRTCQFLTNLCTMP